MCKQGRLRCLGSPSRLKARYGGALALEVQAGASAAAQAALAAWVAAELGAELQVRMLVKGGEIHEPARVCCQHIRGNKAWCVAPCMADGACMHMHRRLCRVASPHHSAL